jgi:Zn finger protein HypA/HybF involved in hydrogenase expression
MSLVKQLAEELRVDEEFLRIALTDLCKTSVKIEINSNKFMCQNCGEYVTSWEDRCPKCGSFFIEEEEV